MTSLIRPIKLNQHGPATPCLSLTGLLTVFGKLRGEIADQYRALTDLTFRRVYGGDCTMIALLVGARLIIIAGRRTATHQL